jgi:hypothetical protein
VSIRVRVALAVAIAAMAASAEAGVTYVPFGTTVPNGESLITDFSTASGLTGSYHLPTGSQGGVTAAPAYSGSSFDAAQYLSIEGLQGDSGATLSFAPKSEVSVYLGSLDDYNTLTVLFQGSGAISYTGSQLASLTTACTGGGQTIGCSNGRFVFDFANKIDGLSFQSGSNAFEVASVAGTGVPEPAGWALMLLGIAAVGAGLRSERRLAASEI